MTSDRSTANQYSASRRFNCKHQRGRLKIRTRSDWHNHLQLGLFGPVASSPLQASHDDAGRMKLCWLLLSSAVRQENWLIFWTCLVGSPHLWLFVTPKPGFYLSIGTKRVIVQPRSTVWDHSAHKSITVQTYCRCSVRKIELHSSAVQSELLSLPVGFIAVQS